MYKASTGGTGWRHWLEAMGLKATGENGAKAQLKNHCTRAFRTYNSLLETRKEIGTTRSETVCLIDMNVVLMSVPSNIRTFESFVRIVWGFVEWALGTGWLTILVFDEPAAMTNAKRLEQARRDAARNAHSIPCSTDIDPFPFTDDYTLSDIDTLEGILAVRDKRASRSRFYDEVSKQIFEMASAKAAAWNASGKPENKTCILFDGVDIRGCERPAFAAREVVMCSNMPDIAEAFKREVAIGEGDLKLQALEDRIRTLAEPDGLLHGTKLVMASTIDTDSLMISALAVSKRRVSQTNQPGSSSNVQSVLCMRSPAARRGQQGGGGGGGGDGGDGGGDQLRAYASYLVVDTVMLEACILEYIYGKAAVVDPKQALSTMLALSACAALSGCDFCSLSGARFDHFFNSLSDFARTEPLALKSFEHCLNADQEVAKKACKGLLRVCYNASVKMEEKGKRYIKQAKSVSEIDDDTLKRAIWTVAYWSGNEHTADESFGFPSLAQRSSTPPVSLISYAAVQMA